MSQTVLILGASGRFGRHCATAFANAGWEVRPFRRGDDLSAAARGVDVIVNGWNPPYPDWAAQVPGLTRQVIAVAEACGATVLIPGNVYVFGEGAPEVLAPGTPHAATNPLGRIRVEMEATYAASSAQTIVLRAGDFIDTEASGNWFDRLMAKDVEKGRFAYPGRRDVVHAWAYLPDLARAAVALAETRGDLATHTDLGFPGYALTGAELHAAVEGVMGRSLKAAAVPWALFGALALVMPMMRGLREMRYLWDMPHRIPSGPFDAVLPGFDVTPLEVALRTALGR